MRLAANKAAEVPMRAKALVLVVGLLTLAGCSNRPKLVPFSGKVVAEGRKQLSGDPIVALVPVGGQGKERIQGMILPDGTFKLNTYPHGDGVTPGKYKVLVQFDGGKAFERYAAANTTPLEVDVPDGGLTNYEIKLTPQK
jgi:hypothetical protein